MSPHGGGHEDHGADGSENGEILEGDFSDERRPSPKHKELQLPDIEYIDTYQNYNIKIKARERQEYWSFLVNSKRKVKEPEGRETDEEVVERTFPPLIGHVFSLVVGRVWDYLYLLLFLIFIILVGLRHDGYLPVFIHHYLSTIYTALLVVMFIAQVIPIIGTVYFITHYNLRTHFRASTEFAQWGFNAVMVAQCIEQFFYGGVGNFIKKKERVYDEPVRMDGDYKYVDDEESSEGASVTDSMKEEMIKRGLWKEKKYHIKGTGKNALEGIDEKDGDEEEGKEGEEEEDEEEEAEEEEERDNKAIENGGVGMLVSDGPGQEGTGMLMIGDVDDIDGQEHDHVTDLEAAGASSGLDAPGTGLGLPVNAGDGMPLGVGNDDGFEVHDSRLTGQEGGERLDAIDQGEKGEGDIETGSYSHQIGIISGGEGEAEDAAVVPVNIMAGIVFKKSGGDDDEEEGALSYMEQLKAKQKAEEEESKRIAAEMKARRDALVSEWLTWTCNCCGTNNRLPRHPKEMEQFMLAEERSKLTSGSVFFDEVHTGELKRTVAFIRLKRDMPSCQKCSAFADYQPPDKSAHLFHHFPGRYVAFSDYPRFVPPRAQASLPPTMLGRFLLDTQSFLYGLRNSSSSKLAWNDWRLKFYLESDFPDIARPALTGKDDFFRIGEIVESNQQKTLWCKAKVFEVRRNHTYDIEYDAGDQLRLISEKLLRLPPAKGDFAYKVEIGMVIIITTFPLTLLNAINQETDAGRANVFVMVLVVAIVLLLLRVELLINYARLFKYSGFSIILSLSMVYLIPIVFLVVASSPLVVAQGRWVSMAAAWIVTKMLAVPFLYTMKPSYGILGAILFLQTSVGFVLTAEYLDNDLQPILTMNLLGLTLAPFATATITLMYYRYILDKVWDVTLTIRYCESKSLLNESLLSRVAYKLFKAWFIFRCIRCGRVDQAKVAADLHQAKVNMKDLERERKIAKMMKEEREMEGR